MNVTVHKGLNEGIMDVGMDGKMDGGGTGETEEVVRMRGKENIREEEEEGRAEGKDDRLG